ncbi:KATNB1-like protein 1 [Oscarella lobularis]|uniref:KATNB1-like protein 1 n=1 Tax=Oscarella lobularis TaxID=121494 RepID=UPI0033142534
MSSKGKAAFATPDEISKGHENMLSVLEERKMRLMASKSLWDKDVNSTIDHILRLNDDSLTVDLLPKLTECVRDGEKVPSSSPALTMGACLELLSLLQRMLNESKYEDYIVIVLDFLLTVTNRWWKTLTEMSNPEDLRHSKSTPGMYVRLIEMSDRVESLAKRRSRAGEKARVFSTLLKQL